MRSERALAMIALLVGGAALGIAAVATVAMVVLAAGGALTTPPGAWAVNVSPLPGLRMKLSVPGLLRFATSPMALRLLDGRSLATRFGTLSFVCDGGSLQALCAPCVFDVPQLAAQPVRIERLRLRLAKSGDRALAGEAGSGGVEVRFTARLQPDRVDIDWQLPPTEIAAVYRLLQSVIPEAHLAHLGGRVDARGSLSLPQRRARVELAVDGFAVDGLGTERLAGGPVDFECPRHESTPAPRRAIPGEGRWISPTQSGSLLAAAVLAAGDRRFLEHEGFDLGSIGEPGRDRGAATITERLARTLFTGDDRTVARALRELAYSVEMERTLGKAMILALYLNTAHWGPGICGADAAARAYFGKRPGELTPLEAAWLASVLRNPQRAYEEEFLARSPDSARAARVLQQMRSLPRPERERALQHSLVFAEPAAPRSSDARLAVAR